MHVYGCDLSILGSPLKNKNTLLQLPILCPTSYWFWTFKARHFLLPSNSSSYLFVYISFHFKFPWLLLKKLLGILLCLQTGLVKGSSMTYLSNLFSYWCFWCRLQEVGRGWWWRGRGRASWGWGCTWRGRGRNTPRWKRRRRGRGDWSTGCISYWKKRISQCCFKQTRFSCNL